MGVIIREFVISKRSTEEIRKIVIYINSRWSERVSRDFLKKLKSNFDIILLNPELYPRLETNNKLCRCVVTKQTTIIYKYNSIKITIVAVFDNRQDPTKLPLK